MKTKIDHTGNFLSFRRKVDIDSEGIQRMNYEYVHENRCNGHIVSVLPINRSENKMLIRRELTPCWQIDGLTERHFYNSLTGGYESKIHQSPIDTVIAELREEAGIVLRDIDNQILSMGTIRGTKSSDSFYHLFVVLLDENNHVLITPEPDSRLEREEYCEWVTGPAMDCHRNDQEILFNIDDPLLLSIHARYMNSMNDIPVTRESYMGGVFK